MMLNTLTDKIDKLNDIRNDNRAALWLERIAFVFMTLMVVFAPHSIAATQSAWIIGMLATALRLIFKPRTGYKLSALDYTLIAFFLWSVVSSVFSYAPDISLDKLRGVSLFLVAIFVIRNVSTRRAARFLAIALVCSTMVSVAWTPIERMIGRGVKIYEFEGSAFDQIKLQEGDVILTIDGKKVNSLEAARKRIFENPTAPQFKMRVSRGEAITDVEVPRERIKDAPTAEESLGIKRWTKSRNWRSAGFYGHYTTFAESLQLILSLTFGLFIVSISRGRLFKTKSDDADETESPIGAKTQFALAVCVGLMVLALILTVTRASQLAFIISAGVIVLLNGNRRLVVSLALVTIPLAIVGLLVLQNLRGVGFFDSKDNSTTWRQTVYGEALDLWTKNARNFTVGVGMDSIKRYAKDWRLFDDGRLPSGHFHSTPIQIAVERGLPGLIIWLTILGIYARTLWRGIKMRSQIEKGILLGCFGGLVGFFTSGLVHYNLGDGEVATVFYMLMGVAMAICRLPDDEQLTR